MSDERPEDGDPACPRPSYRMPENACDTHCHIFGPSDAYPLPESAAYTFHDAPLPALRALHARLGVTRAVIVNSTAYGTDHRIALDAVAQSDGRYRAVANLDEATSERDIDRLHRGGFRGCRFCFVEHLGETADWRLVERIAAMVAPFGWHLDLLIDASRLVDRRDRLQGLPLPYVIDHLGRVDAEAGPDHPALAELINLFQSDPKCWVKLSGLDRVTANSPMLRAAVPLAHAVMRTAPDRVLWGSDWPHPNVRSRPRDEELVDLIPLFAPKAEWQKALLVDNPARLYGF